jgi:NADH dehydrogenase/NADH:ubiquinone oxidoreductase subunit G
VIAGDCEGQIADSKAMADVNLTVDGKKITAPAGSLLIEACKSAGIEVPSFCYYPGSRCRALAACAS